MAELDEFDYRLLALLQENSRLTGNALSEAVGLSPAACLRRVQRLRETGVIERDVAVLSPKVFGHQTTIIVMLTIKRDRPDRGRMLREQFSKMPEVVTCRQVTGAADFVLTVVVSDMEEYNQFTETYFYEPYIQRFESLAVMATVKQSLQPQLTGKIPR